MSAQASDPARLSLGALTMPVAMGYVPLGTVFGFLFVQAGGPWWLALVSSVVVYAGASQFMMIPMLAASMPLSTIALATLVINLRHVFYGLSLLERLPHRAALRAYLSFALTDETYSVITTLPAQTAPSRLVAVAALNQGWWLVGTALGALLGAQAQVTLKGLDFALCALFAVLAVEQWRSRSSAMPLWTAVAAYGVALWWWPQQALALAMAACVLVGGWLAPRQEHRA